MTKRRRNLFLVGGLAAVVVVAAAIAVGIAVGSGDDEDKLSYPGRIGVRNGCGLTNFFQDGSDQAELCLTDVWDAVSLSWNGDQLAWDTRDQGIRVGDYDDPSEPFNVSTPQGTNYVPSLSPDAERVAFLHSPQDDGRYDIWVAG